MTMLHKFVLAGVAALFLASLPMIASAQTASAPIQLAQMQPGQGGMMQPGQPGTMQPGQGGMMQPGQQGGMQPGGQGGNSCTQSYQRCVMMCAGVANCINNCNVGYAMCTNSQKKGPQGGRK